MMWQIARLESHKGRSSFSELLYKLPGLDSELISRDLEKDRQLELLFSSSSEVLIDLALQSLSHDMLTRSRLSSRSD